MSFQSPNSQKPFHQLVYLGIDLNGMVNRKRLRWFGIWFSGTTYDLISYRLDRFGFLLFKKSWRVIRLLFFPLFIVFHLFGAHHEIHYTADLGAGLKILHGALGVVVSGKTVAGKNLLLTGGNCIGVRSHLEQGDLILGNDVSLGANAVVLGPARVGDNVKIGAGAVVIDDAPDGAVLVGVPAKNIRE